MARLFKWGNSHEIYLPEIDAEHRALFEIGEKIQLAVQSGADVEHLKPMVEALITCAEDHFAHEERLMVAARYEAYEWHKAQHDGVRRRMRSFLKGLEQGETQAAQLMIEYFSEWIDDHAALTDRMMGAALRNYDRALHRRAMLRRSQNPGVTSLVL